MLVYIESFWGDKLITGKKCTEKELREKFKKAIEKTETEDFTSSFCHMFQFDELPLDKKVQVDYVIDLDTHIVYTPRYNAY